MGDRVRSVGEAIENLDRDTVPGYPWKKMGFSTKGDLVDCPDLEETYNRYEREVEDWYAHGRGKQPVHYFYVFGKKDFYSMKKIEGKTRRTIQCADTMSTIFLDRWLGKRIRAVEDNEIGVACANTPEQTRTIYEMLRESGFAKESVGYDFTAWDRSLPTELLEITIEELCRGLPKWVVDHVKYLHCHSPFIVSGRHGGIIIFRTGGTPSGIFITSIINTILHDGIDKVFYWMKDLPVVLMSAGDDGIHFGDERIVESIPDYVEYAKGLGLEAKPDMETGSGTDYVSFLATKYILLPSKGIWVRIPTDFGRATQKFPEAVTSDDPSVLYNMFVEISGLVLRMREGVPGDSFPPLLNWFDEYYNKSTFQLLALHGYKSQSLVVDKMKSQRKIGKRSAPKTLQKLKEKKNTPIAKPAAKPQKKSVKAAPRKRTIRRSHLRSDPSVYHAHASAAALHPRVVGFIPSHYGNLRQPLVPVTLTSSFRIQIPTGQSGQFIFPFANADSSVGSDKMVAFYGLIAATNSNASATAMTYYTYAQRLSDVYPFAAYVGSDTICVSGPGNVQCTVVRGSYLDEYPIFTWISPNSTFAFPQPAGGMLANASAQYKHNEVCTRFQSMYGTPVSTVHGNPLAGMPRAKGEFFDANLPPQVGWRGDTPLAATNSNNGLSLDQLMASPAYLGAAHDVTAPICCVENVSANTITLLVDCQRTYYLTPTEQALANVSYSTLLESTGLRVDSRIMLLASGGAVGSTAAEAAVKKIDATLAHPALSQPLDGGVDPKPIAEAVKANPVVAKSKPKHGDSYEERFVGVMDNAVKPLEEAGEFMWDHREDIISGFKWLSELLA